MCAEAGFEVGIRTVSSGQQDVGPRKCGLVGLGQVAVGMVVVDLGDEVFGETGLTGPVETDLPSETAVGDAGIAEANEFLDVLTHGAVRPHRGVETVEALPQRRRVAEDRSDGGGTVRVGGWEAGRGRHQ